MAMGASAFYAGYVVTLSRIRKLSGGFLHRNWLSIPHVTQHDEADITELEAFRKKEAVGQQGVKLTLLGFLMKATVVALKQFPEFNSSLSPDNDSLILKQYFHIGVAVDTPNGLVVPVIRDVDPRLVRIARDAKHLVKRSFHPRSLFQLPGRESRPASGAI